LSFHCLQQEIICTDTLISLQCFDIVGCMTGSLISAMPKGISWQIKRGPRLNCRVPRKIGPLNKNWM